MKINHIQSQRRRDALSTLDEFNEFLRLGQRGGPRSLSPAKALEHLENVNVVELLGHRVVHKIQMAAELLA